MSWDSRCILDGLFSVTKAEHRTSVGNVTELLNSLRILLKYSATHMTFWSYTFWRLMNFWESAIRSGIVPRTGRFPPPSLRTNSFTARSITQKGELWNAQGHWKVKNISTVLSLVCVYKCTQKWNSSTPLMLYCYIGHYWRGLSPQ